MNFKDDFFFNLLDHSFLLFETQNQNTVFISVYLKIDMYVLAIIKCRLTVEFKDRFLDFLIW